MRFHKLAVVALFAASPLMLAGHCKPTPPVDPSQPDSGVGGSVGTGGAAPTIDERCADACENMRMINEREPCPGYSGEPSDAGTTCETTCVANEVSTVARWCTDEVARATDCASLQSAWDSCE